MKDLSKKKRSETPCHFFASEKGCRKGDKCEYLHEAKPGGVPDTKPMVSVMEYLPEKNPGGVPSTKPLVSVIVCGLQNKKENEDRVLVDSGANEAVRPHSSSWWNEIIILRNKGKPVTVKLAGGQEIRAAMTQHGEIMLPGREDQDRASWILPVSRLTKELGIKR